jgi:uncharacterized protein involved in outer membrane biogenesis
VILAATFLDINSYKPEVEKLVAKYAKVDAKINGDMKIGLSFKPSIEINDVDISNQEDKSPIAQIGAALVEFSIKPLFAKEIVVNTVQTDNTKIYYSPTEYAEINNLDVSMDAYDSPINIDLDTDVSGVNIKAVGTLSSLKKITESNYNEVEADLKVSAMGYIVNYKGKVYDLQSAVKADGKYTVEYKKNKINGNVYVDLAPKTPYLKLTADSQNINLQDFTDQKQASAGNMISSANASTLVANTPIPYDYLKMVDADIDFKIKQLIIDSAMMLKDINAQINLKNGVFKANFKNIGAGNGNISGTVNTDANQKTTSVNLKGNNIILQQFYTPFSQNSNPTLFIKEGGKTNFDIVLNTSGANTNQYIANSKGQIIAFVDSSVMKISSLDKLRGNIIVQILDTLKLNVNNSDLKVKCAVVRGDITSGNVNYPKGIVFDAKDFYLVADGRMDLNNETLNLSLQPFSGKIKDVNISSLLGSLLKIKGTFNNPKVSINKEQTATAVVGAIATGGMYNVGDMMLSADASPCHTALKGTSYAGYFPEEKGVTNTVSKQYTNTKDAIKGAGKQVKTLGKDLKNAGKDAIGGLLGAFGSKKE